jgi:hypothetical protein
MGKLIYDSTMSTDFEDRLLAHLQIVIGLKLRRNESFYFGWRDNPETGDGRSVIWMHPALPLRYKYLGGRIPAINRAWIEALTATANSTGGLQVVPEPELDVVPESGFEP